jgi:hypothetical protein
MERRPTMPFCPECKSAFKQGVTECPDCKVQLVEKLDEGETADFVELYKVSSLIEAEAIQALLVENGIENFFKSTGIPSLPMTGEEGMITIEVRSDQVEAARKLIKAFEAAPPEIDESTETDGGNA